MPHPPTLLEQAGASSKENYSDIFERTQTKLRSSGNPSVSEPHKIDVNVNVSKPHNVNVNVSEPHSNS